MRRPSAGIVERQIQGHALAQAKLGLRYSKGQGVPQDYRKAARWYRKAAQQGNDNAQFLLGHLYRQGRGVPQDYVLAYMWFSLSAAQGDKAARRARDSVTKRMTRAQIARANRLAREWKPKE